MSWRGFLMACAERETMSALSIQLAGRIAALEPVQRRRDEIFLAAALVGHAVDQGHSCLKLDAVGSELERLALTAGIELPPPPDVEQWLTDWCQTTPVSTVVSSQSDTAAPLIIEGNDRLYLRRYAQLERQLRDYLRVALKGDQEFPSNSLPPGLDPAQPNALFERGHNGPNWQAVAAALAVRRRFCVISGGPGTGKTFTIVRLMATLLAWHESLGERHRIAVCAPTGKAAQRVAESIAAELSNDQLRQFFAAHPGVEQGLRPKALTIHRLLGMQPHQAHPKRHADSPINADTVIVDESSMVDLALMARLTRALKPGARLVLVGDRNQLPPVEAGSVFADLCALAGSHVNHYGGDTADYLSRSTGSSVPTRSRVPLLANHLVELRDTYRMNKDLEYLAMNINRGVIDNSEFSFSAQRMVINRRLLAQEIVTRVDAEGGWFETLRQAESPTAALQAMRRFRVLCAVRGGPFGVHQVNQLIEQQLGKHYHFRSDRRPYHLMPIMIRINDPAHDLNNGDVGVLFRGKQGLLAHFEGDMPQQTRSLAPGILPGFDVCYAMTIHKAQGSEFDAVTVILPEPDTPILTRELLYTAVTRARSRVDCWEVEGAMSQAVARRSERMGGRLV